MPASNKGASRGLWGTSATFCKYTPRRSTLALTQQDTHAWTVGRGMRWVHGGEVSRWVHHVGSLRASAGAAYGSALPLVAAPYTAAGVDLLHSSHAIAAVLINCSPQGLVGLCTGQGGGSPPMAAASGTPQNRYGCKCCELQQVSVVSKVDVPWLLISSSACAPQFGRPASQMIPLPRRARPLPCSTHSTHNQRLPHPPPTHPPASMFTLGSCPS